MVTKGLVNRMQKSRDCRVFSFFEDGANTLIKFFMLNDGCRPRKFQQCVGSEYFVIKSIVGYFTLDIIRDFTTVNMVRYQY